MPLEWTIFQIFVNTVEVGALFYLLCSKFTVKYKTFIPTLIFIVGSVGFLSLGIFISSFEYLPIAEIFIPLACFIYLLLYREGGILRKIFWTFCSCILLFSINLVSIMIITGIGEIYARDIMVHQPSAERLIVMIIAKTLQVIVFYILSKRQHSSETKNYLSALPMIVCFSIPLSSLVLMIFIYVLVMNDVYIPLELAFPVAIIYLFINIMVFVLYEIISKEAEKNYMLIAKQKQYELTEQHNSQVIKIYDKMSEWRHDYTNHMQLVVGMLEKADSGDNNEAINYIKDLDEKIKSTSLEIVTGNLVVDAIISAKATLASVHNINFEHNIFLKDDIPIENTDLCSILSNLLDNAIEACHKLNENRYINLEIIIFKNQFNVKITNTTDGEYKLENGKLKTTKNGNLHGIGMGHVKSIVESYGGIFDIKPESESFTTYVSIPLARKSVK